MDALVRFEGIFLTIFLLVLGAGSFVMIPYRNWLFYTGRVKCENHPTSAALPLSKVLFLILLFVLLWYLYGTIELVHKGCSAADCGYYPLMLLPIGCLYALSEFLFQKGVTSS